MRRSATLPAGRILALLTLFAWVLASTRAVPLPAMAAQGERQPPATLAAELETTYPFYQNAAIARAVTYLQSQQQASGGIDSFGFGADVGGTARALYALQSVGYPAGALTASSGASAVDFLRTQVVSYTYANASPAASNLFPGRAGLVLAGISAAGEDPTSFGGINLVAELKSTLRATGAYSTTAQQGFSSGAASDTNQTLAILGLVAAGQPIPSAATDWLIARQQVRGSWSNNIDITAYAVLALIGSGNVDPSSAPIQRALGFFRAAQTSATALWGDAGEGEPANSTGWTMNALAAAGFTPVTASWANGGTNPRQALLGLQNAEGVIARRYFNAYATLEALYGLSDQPIFFAPPLRLGRGLSYLAAKQNDDGGWPNFGTASTAGGTLDTLFAFTAAGIDPASVTKGGNTALSYLRSQAAAYTRDDQDRIFPAQTGKLIVGVVASGGNPASFGTPAPLNLVANLESTLQATGAYSTTAARGFDSGAASVTNQSFAMLGLAAAQRSIPASASAFLIGLQQADGGWGSADETGIALQALRAAGVPPDNPAVVKGITYLRDTQAPGGGWEAFGAISVNSTAYAIQGLRAAGVDLSTAPWLKQGRSPLGVLASYQKPDGPFVANWNYAGISSSYNPTADNLSATQQALPVLAGAFYPYRAPGAPATFSPIKRGPDPDRMVAGAAAGVFTPDRQRVTVTIPFGSDLNGNGTVTLGWRGAGAAAPAAAFTPVPTVRAQGFYTATINLQGTGVTSLDTIQFQATFSDPDTVQSGGTTGSQVVVESELAPQRVYLPIARS